MAPLSLFGFLTFILATTALASSDASSSKNQLNPLLKRQSDAFVPDKNHGNGATCADAFGPGYYSCGTGIECVNPSKGQTCCSEGYGCPRNSFCLVKGFCCPDGLSPESCARANSVTLPADYTTAGVPLSNTTTPSTSISLSAIASTTHSTRASSSTTVSSSLNVGTSTGTVVVLVPTSVMSTATGNASAGSTSTTTATTTRPSVELSTGAASAWRKVGGGEGGLGVWGVVGLVGVLGVVGGAV